MSIVRTLVDAKVPMRDGVALSADIFLPPQAEPAPTVLVRTPYGNNTDLHIEKGRNLASRGYAAVIQDVRGRWDSDGSYYPVVNEADDGYDTLEWIAAQPWSHRQGRHGGRVLSGHDAVVGRVAGQPAPDHHCAARCAVRLSMIRPVIRMALCRSAC